MTNFDPQSWFFSGEKLRENFLWQTFRNLTSECHVAARWNGCKNAQMIQANTNNKDNELRLNKFKLEMKTEKPLHVVIIHLRTPW